MKDYCAALRSASRLLRAMPRNLHHSIYGSGGRGDDRGEIEVNLFKLTLLFEEEEFLHQLANLVNLKSEKNLGLEFYKLTFATLHT